MRDDLAEGHIGYDRTLCTQLLANGLMRPAKQSHYSVNL